jgi:hypothetical protein
VDHVYAQVADVGGDREAMVIVGDDEGGVGQWSGHRQGSQPGEANVGTGRGGRGQVLICPQFGLH